jgi:Fe-S cluster biogenesis protein NfuA
MATDALAQFVINQAKGIVSTDGGDVWLTDVRDSIAYVRFKRGHNPECATCVIQPDDFRSFLTEMFSQRAPHIKDIELEVVDS